MSQSDLERLQRLLNYSPKTGTFFWKDTSPRRRKFLNRPAGSYTGKMHRIIHIQGYQYKAEDLAWLFCHGEWPKNLLRHLNDKPFDNRIENLVETRHPRSLRYEIICQLLPST